MEEVHQVPEILLKGSSFWGQKLHPLRQSYRNWARGTLYAYEVGSQDGLLQERVHLSTIQATALLHLWRKFIFS